MEDRNANKVLRYYWTNALSYVWEFAAKRKAGRHRIRRDSVEQAEEEEHLKMVDWGGGRMDST